MDAQQEDFERMRGEVIARLREGIPDAARIESLIDELGVVPLYREMTEGIHFQGGGRIKVETISAPRAATCQTRDEIGVSPQATVRRLD